MKTAGLILALFFILGISPVLAIGRDDVDEPFLYANPEVEARHAHEMAASDVIYEQQDIKALYYQNQQIIELLRQIHDEVQSLNKRQAKEEQPKA